MPRRRYALPAFALLGVLAAVLLTGCTAVGFGIGSLADMSSGKQTVGGLSNLRTGTRVTMWLRDGRKLQGRYLGCRDSLSATPLPEPPASALGTVVPLRAVVVLGTEDGPQQLPFEIVERVSVPVARGKWIGLVVGLIADAAAVFIAYMAAGAGTGNVTY